MREQYTVDVLAGAIANQVGRARPSPRLTYRFYRQGRRDGHRLLRGQPMRVYITAAVGIAGSSICEEYLAARQPLQARGTVLRGSATLQTPPSSSSVSGTASLASALGVMRERRAAQASHELSTTEAELAGLPGVFRQRLVSCHEVGKLLWSRYCIGYERGKSKRGAPDEDEQVPNPEIEFDMPCEFGEADPPGSADHRKDR